MRQTIFVLLGTLVFSGCDSSASGGGDSGYEQYAPAFPEGTGQAPNGTKAYPPGPFGVGKGSIIANYKLIGNANAQKSTALQDIELADFYNPSGDAKFEEGSIFEVGAPKPKVVLLGISAVWCGPCNYEADVVFPPLYAKYKPLGGEFFIQLADGATPGKAATSKNLLNWTTKYDVDYPMAIDPSSKLSALYEQDAFPNNIIIKTSTMEIIEIAAGAQEAGGSFWKTYEKVLNGAL